MLKIHYHKEPIYTLEALDLLEMIANHEELANPINHVDQKLVTMINGDLKAIVSSFPIKEADFYRYFKNTRASLASCLINSFVDPSQIKLNELKTELLKTLADFKDMRCDSAEIVERLNISRGNQKSLFDEILRLKIDDHDKIILLKALSDPKPYLDVIVEDIKMVKKELVRIYQKYSQKMLLDYFTKDKIDAILKEVNLNYEGDIYIFTSVVHHHSLSIVIDDVNLSPLKMRVGLSLDVSSIDDFSFFHDDLEERLKNFIRVISDPSKLKIIELLKKQEMYGAQLAQSLSLKTPTISYHVDALMNAGIIKAKRKDKRVYFEYDKKHTLAIIDYLKQKFS